MKKSSMKKFWNRFFGILLSISLIMSSWIGVDFGGVSKVVLAAEPLYTFELSDAPYFAGGDGSESSPYEISNVQQLINLSVLVNGNHQNPGVMYYRIRVSKGHLNANHYLFVS